MEFALGFILLFLIVSQSFTVESMGFENGRVLRGPFGANVSDTEFTCGPGHFVQQIVVAVTEDKDKVFTVNMLEFRCTDGQIGKLGRMPAGGAYPIRARPNSGGFDSFLISVDSNKNEINGFGIGGPWWQYYGADEPDGPETISVPDYRLMGFSGLGGDYVAGITLLLEQPASIIDGPVGGPDGSPVDMFSCAHGQFIDQIKVQYTEHLGKTIINYLEFQCSDHETVGKIGSYLLELSTHTITNVAGFDTIAVAADFETSLKGLSGFGTDTEFHGSGKPETFSHSGYYLTGFSGYAGQIVNNIELTFGKKVMSDSAIHFQRD